MSKGGSQFSRSVHQVVRPETQKANHTFVTDAKPSRSSISYRFGVSAIGWRRCSAVIFRSAVSIDCQAEVFRDVAARHREWNFPYFSAHPTAGLLALLAPSSA